MQALEEQYNRACYAIVDEMNDKFIDLCVDDNNSEIGHRMPQQQAAFTAQLEKLNFQFETKSLDMPRQAGEDGAVAALDKESKYSNIMGRNKF